MRELPGGFARRLNISKLDSPFSVGSTFSFRIGCDKAVFVFPSLRAQGKKPLYTSIFVADYLRPAAILAGVSIADGQRFGMHNLRHSLSNWLVNKGKVEPKTVQGILRHAKIQTTLDLYTQEDSDETRSAQGEFLAAMKMKTEAIQ
jgi:integrase